MDVNEVLEKNPGLKQSVERIERGASAKIEELRRKTAGEVARIEKEAEERTRQLREAILEEGRLRAQSQRDRLLSMARLEERKAFLSAKRGLLDEVFRDARTWVDGLGQENVLDFLAPLAVEAVKNGDEELILSSGEREKLGTGLVSRVNELLRGQGKPSGVRLSEEAHSLGKGFILRGSKWETNCTFDAMFRRTREELEPEVAGVIFSDKE